MQEPIDDLDDPRVRNFRSLRLRSERGESVPVADGLRVLATVVDLGVPIGAVLTSDEALPAVESLLARLPEGSAPPVLVAPGALLSEVVGFRYHGGVMATVTPPSSEVAVADLGARVVALAGVEKGENLGAIARSALAFGCTGLLIDAAGAHPFQRSTIRASRGTILGLAVRRSHDLAADLASLGSLGHRRIGTTPRGGSDLAAAVPPDGTPWTLVLGGEGHGAPDAVLRACDERVTISLRAPVESLNVAATAAVILHALDAGRDGREGGGS